MASHHAHDIQIEGSGAVQFGDIHNITVHHHHPQQTAEDIDSSILESFAFTEMLDRRTNTSNPHPRTCGWILKHEAYEQWTQRPRGILWVKGKPGVGKSTLMKFLFDKHRSAQASSEGIIMEFFFYAQGAELQRTCSGMLRAFLHQLYRRDLIVKSIIQNSYDEKQSVYGQKSLVNWSDGDLEDLFLQSVVACSRERYISIFVDALDEAGEVHARKIVAYLHKVNDRIDVEHGTAKICISCRHQPVTSVIPGLEVHVENYNNEDIRSYVHDTLNLEHLIGENSTEWTAWAGLRDNVVQQASGIFQWASLVTPWLVEDVLDGESIEFVLRRLKEVPTELDGVYRHILERVIKIKHRMKAFFLFKWVCLSARQLKLDELRYAIATSEQMFDEKCVTFEGMTTFVKTDDKMKDNVRTWSGGLLELKAGSQTPEVIHQSVSDFMLSQGFSSMVSLLGGEWSKLPRKQILPQLHVALFRACVQYTKIIQAKYGIAEFLKYESRDLIHEPEARDAYYRRHKLIVVGFHRFLRYALDEVAFHASMSDGLYLEDDDTSAVCHLVQDFLPLREKCRRRPAYSPPLHLAAEIGLLKLVRILLREGADVNARNSQNRTALHFASEKSHCPIIYLLLELGADASAKCEAGQTALHLASLSGNTEVVLALLKAGVGVNDTDAHRRTALHYAVSSQNEVVVRKLLDAGADVNAKDAKRRTALLTAVEGSNERVVKVVLEAGASTEDKDESRFTALHKAAVRGHDKVVTELLRKKANVSTPDVRGCTALDLVSRNRGRDFLVLFLTAATSVKVQLQMPHEAGSLSDERMKHAIHDKFDFEYKDGTWIATISDSHDGARFRRTLQLLLELEPCWERKNKFQTLALHRAVTYIKKDKIIQNCILDHVQGPFRGRTAGYILEVAMREGFPSVIEKLLKDGIDWENEQDAFSSSLQIAAKNGLDSVVEELLANKELVSRAKLEHVLVIAVKNRHITVVDRLIKAGADVNGESLRYTPLATMNSDTAMIDTLVKAAANVNSSRTPSPNPFSTHTDRAWLRSGG